MRSIPVPPRLFLRSSPWHRHVAVGLAWRRRDDQRSVAELRAVNRPHVLEHELRGVAMLAVDVLLNVEADHVEAFGQQPFGPATEAAEQVDCEWSAHGVNHPSRDRYNS